MARAITLKTIEFIIKAHIGAADLANVIAMEKIATHGMDGRVNVGSDAKPVYEAAPRSSSGYIYSQNSLYNQLQAVGGVDNIDYSDLSDPVVIFSLDARLDNTRKRTRIAKIIREHVAVAREWAKANALAEAAQRKPSPARSTAKTILHRNRRR